VAATAAARHPDACEQIGLCITSRRVARTGAGSFFKLSLGAWSPQLPFRRINAGMPYSVSLAVMA